jgi:hypothetical protein
MLLFHLAVELVVGVWGLFVLAREQRNVEAHPKTAGGRQMAVLVGSCP